MDHQNVEARASQLAGPANQQLPQFGNLIESESVSDMIILEDAPEVARRRRNNPRFDWAFMMHHSQQLMSSDQFLLALNNQG